MNTLKIKVLLFISNRYLHHTVSRALFIWVATCVLGCLSLYAFDFLMFPPAESVMLSLIFSSPSLLIAIPFLYHLSTIQTIPGRIMLGTGLIVLTSGGIIGFVALFFNLRYSEVAEALLPFIPTALVCFMSISRKQILSTR